MYSQGILMLTDANVLVLSQGDLKNINKNIIQTGYNFLPHLLSLPQQTWQLEDYSQAAPPNHGSV